MSNQTRNAFVDGVNKTENAFVDGVNGWRNEFVAGVNNDRNFSDGVNRARSGLTGDYETWDEATETWDEATQTWDHARGYVFPEGVNKTRIPKP
jgi:hypothetical protein